MALPEVIAWLEEMHAWVTVWQGMVLGRPAERTASLATLLVFTSWITVPTVQCSTSPTATQC